MSFASVPESIAGFLLVFFVPGYAVTKATFPEWRIRGSSALRRLVEVTTASFVLSIVLTVVVGYLLLTTGPSGFQASWSDPLLETCLAAVALVAFAVGWMRGAYRREPPEAPQGLETYASEEGAWELSRQLDRLQREEQRVLRELGVSERNAADRTALTARLEELRAERAELGRKRETDYAN